MHDFLRLELTMQLLGDGTAANCILSHLCSHVCHQLHTCLRTHVEPVGATAVNAASQHAVRAGPPRLCYTALNLLHCLQIGRSASTTPASCTGRSHSTCAHSVSTLRISPTKACGSPLSLPGPQVAPRCRCRHEAQPSAPPQRSPARRVLPQVPMRPQAGHQRLRTRSRLRAAPLVVLTAPRPAPDPATPLARRPRVTD